MVHGERKLETPLFKSGSPVGLCNIYDTDDVYFLEPLHSSYTRTGSQGQCHDCRCSIDPRLERVNLRQHGNLKFWLIVVNPGLYCQNKNCILRTKWHWLGHWPHYNLEARLPQYYGALLSALNYDRMNSFLEKNDPPDTMGLMTYI